MRTPVVASRTRALLAVSLGVFCVQLDAFALPVALRRLVHDLPTSSADPGWVLSAYLLSSGTFMLGAGRLGDLWGRRRLLIVGLALFGAAAAGCALAPTLPVLIGARVVQGAGAALVMPVGLALLSQRYPGALRGRAIGWALGLGGIATASGPFIGGAVTEAWSWRVVFWLAVPLTALGIGCAASSAAPRSAARGGTSSRCGARPVDWRGLLLATAALGVLALVLDRGRQGRWDAVLFGLVGVAALVILLVRRERATAHPLVAPALFRNGPFMALTLGGAVANTATVVFLYTVPGTLQGQWALSVSGAGTAFALPALAMAVAGPVAGRIPARLAVRLMAGALGGMAALFGCLAQASSLTVYLTVATIGGGVLGMANSLTLVATQTAIDPLWAGEASGVTKTVLTLAAGLGITLAASASGHSDGMGARTPPDQIWWITALGCLTSGFLLARLHQWASVRPRRRGRA
ncbi:MFS transporter [Streptomyces albipurpureus]|uniref:MFS transporter n=1 Tax=Streptomyces albipurpureus TaxID=2897419 RepID=A0ABT0UH20_9ACTN|nr:MFS transporter [Streptomyces sp. CWNU-1]MCM2387734.1 MFS transporter [Streptomyces sp. CWNU-1]